MLRKLCVGLAVAVVLIAIGGAGFVAYQASAFDRSLEKVYAVPAPNVHSTGDPAVIARGQHLVAVGGCGACHGDDLGGKPGEDMGPLGSMPGANITAGKGGIGARYSDDQLANVIRHGIKASGKTLVFMPSQDLSWWPDDDLSALVSYLRTVPPVDRTMPAGHVGVLGKVLDRVGVIPLDIARRIDHRAPAPKTLPPMATADYGAKLARTCVGCHGEHFSGGPIPGAPSNLPVPANITPHASGLASATEADWTRLLDTGIKRDGKPLDPFMPIQMLRAMDTDERGALWKFLRSLPPRPFGER